MLGSEFATAKPPISPEPSLSKTNSKWWRRRSTSILRRQWLEIISRWIARDPSRCQRSAATEGADQAVFHSLEGRSSGLADSESPGAFGSAVDGLFVDAACVGFTALDCRSGLVWRNSWPAHATKKPRQDQASNRGLRRVASLCLPTAFDQPLEVISEK